ncbi:hypothetical protein THAOC_11644 [Thalassiosira oceanica]|uniref:Transmembrane protein n=1 Tax=Thalassiosira oceanica TaxID=159749 RepID=K0SPU2_THAOC|nr:hypothetical protein THAOC_11644 [Thalassiosira oceanica]|eukprot:EJK67340.1 hypothetical protein THAOC_11644 [Thalassiosira oceanica]
MLKDTHELGLQSFLPTIADYAVGAGTFSLTTAVLFSLSSLLAVDTYVIKRGRRKTQQRFLAPRGSMTVSSGSRADTTFTPDTHSVSSRCLEGEHEPTLSEELDASDLAVKARVKAALISNAAAQLQDLAEKENPQSNGMSLERDREIQWMDQHDELKLLQDELSRRSDRARSNEKFQRDLLKARLSNAAAKQARMGSTPSIPNESFHRALLAAQLANRNNDLKSKHISGDPSISKEGFQRSLLSAQLGYSRRSSAENYFSENLSSDNEGAHLTNSKATERENRGQETDDTDFQRSLLSARIANDRTSNQHEIAAYISDQGVSPSPSPLKYTSKHGHDFCQDASERVSSGEDALDINTIDDSATQLALDVVENFGIQATKEKMLKKLVMETEPVVLSEMKTDTTERRVKVGLDLGRRIRQKRTYIVLTLATMLGRRLISAWLGA